MQVIGMIRIKDIIFSKTGAFVIISLAVLINTLVYSSFYCSACGDQGLSISPNFSLLFNSMFIWQPLNYSGVIANLPSSINLFFSVFFTALEIAFGTAIIRIFNTWVFLVIGGSGILFLILELSKNFDRRFAFFGAYISVIFFIVTFAPIYSGQSVPVILLPYVLLLLYKTISTQKPFSFKNKQALLTFSLLTLTTATAISLGGVVYLIKDLSLIIFFSIFVITLSGRKIKAYHALVPILFSIVLSILIFLPVITSNYLLSQNQRGTYNTIVTGNIGFFTQHGGNAVIYAFSAFSNYDIPNSPTTITLMLLFFIALFGSLHGFNSKDLRRIFILGTVVLYFLFLVLGTHDTPFSNFTLAASNNIPYYYIFSIQQSYPILLLLFATMIGYAVTNISELIENIHIVYRVLFFTLLLIFIVVYLYNYEYLLITQNTYAQFQQSGIPRYVYQISDYINSQNGTFSVGTLPTVSPYTTWQFSTWYTGVNAYESLIRSSVYTGSLNIYDEFFPPQTPEKYYRDISDSIAMSRVNYSVSNMFDVFGIHYIILQGDTLHLSNSSPLAPIWNSSLIYYNLNNSKNIKYIASFNSSAIFEVVDYTPIVYASNVKNVGDLSNGELFNVITNHTFNPNSMVVYTTNNSYLFNSSGKIPVLYIQNFKQAAISFNYLSPTKVSVIVTNATTPFYLVFRETYDPAWTAYYSNGSKVNMDKHIQVNGFANAWYINKTGNYTMTLYYAPQTVAWISWAISFGALGLTIYIGYLGFRNKKRR